MASMSEELLMVLTNEMTIYKKLSEHAKNKTQSLVKNKVDEIKEITDKEQILISELKKAERKREEILTDLKDVMNDKDLTLSKLFSRLPENDRKRFVELKSSILDVLDELRKYNKQNEALIKEGLNITEYTLNAIQTPNRMETNSYAGEVGGYGSGSMRNRPRYFESRS